MQDIVLNIFSSVPPLYIRHFPEQIVLLVLYFSFLDCRANVLCHYNITAMTFLMLDEY